MAGEQEEESQVNMDYIELDESILIPPDQMEAEISAVKNRIASSGSEMSWDDVNYSSRSQERMAEDVYNDLKNLESETFAKLQEERGGNDAEERYDEPEEQEVEDRDDYRWFGEERSYGAATVEFDLEGREGMDLPPPAYRCKGSGKVVLQIEVKRDGSVDSAEIIESNVSSVCLEEEAVQYALRSRFNSSLSSPKKQSGRIIYRFVAQ